MIGMTPIHPLESLRPNHGELRIPRALPQAPRISPRWGWRKGSSPNLEARETFFHKSNLLDIAYFSAVDVLLMLGRRFLPAVNKYDVREACPSRAMGMAPISRNPSGFPQNWRRRGRSSFLAALIFSLACAAQAQTPDTRSLKICVASDAPASIQTAAKSVLSAVTSQPLLSAMAHGKAITALTDTNALMSDKLPARAYDHLVLIGLLTDPAIQAAWQREAKAEPNGLYAFGFGHLSGDLGYIESDRNPFLHSLKIPKTPYEDEIVILTGSTPAGVALAVQAFLKQGLVNGIVAAPGWKRPKANLLEHDPLDPSFTLPDVMTDRIGLWQRIGVTQAAEDEYRGVLADTGVEPQAIWRAKYYTPGVWDGAGADHSLLMYSNGLQRRAYGDTLWCARFATEQQATAAAPKIAAAGGLHKAGNAWVGAQPPFGFGTDTGGSIALRQQGEWVLMSTLPAEGGAPAK